MGPPPWASKSRPVQSNYPAFQHQQQQDVVFDPQGMSTNVQRKQSLPSEVLVQAGVRSSVPKLNNLPSQFSPTPQQFYNPDFQQSQQYFPEQQQYYPQPQRQQQFFSQPQQPYLSQDFLNQSPMNTVGHPQGQQQQHHQQQPQQQKIGAKPMQNGAAPVHHQQMQRPGPPAKPRPHGGHQQVANVYQPAGQGAEGGSAQTGFPFLKITGSSAYQPQPDAQTSPKKHRWTLDKLRATDAIIPLQSGTNQFSSQRGMTGFGTPRDVRGKHVHRLWEEEYPEYIVDYYSKQ